VVDRCDTAHNRLLRQCRLDRTRHEKAPEPVRSRRISDAQLPGSGAALLSPYAPPDSVDRPAGLRDHAVRGPSSAIRGPPGTAIWPATGSRSAPPAGVIVNVSIWGKPASIDMQKLVLKEIDLRGTIAYVRDHPATIKLVQDGKIDLKPFITGRIALTDLIEEGLGTLIDHKDTAV
jgi:hypothetical protein